MFHLVSSGRIVAGYICVLRGEVYLLPFVLCARSGNTCLWDVEVYLSIPFLSASLLRSGAVGSILWFTLGHNRVLKIACNTCTTTPDI